MKIAHDGELRQSITSQGYSLEELRQCRASQVIRPVFDSERVANKLPDGLPIYQLRLVGYTQYEWNKIELLKLDIADRMQQTGRHAVELIRQGMCTNRVKEYESVWSLLGYLMTVGPVLFQICALKQFTFRGEKHIALWTKTDVAPEFHLLLLPWKNLDPAMLERATTEYILVRK